jgi:hypothetical protein
VAWTATVQAARSVEDATRKEGAPELESVQPTFS